MRGEIWTMRDDLYASKARPVVIVQSDEIVGFDSVVLCLMTTFESSGMPTRIRVEPSEENGLDRTSFVMTDKIASVSRSMLGKRIGILERDRMDEVAEKLALVLGLSQSLSAKYGRSAVMNLSHIDARLLSKRVRREVSGA